MTIEDQILDAAARVEKRSGRSYAWMIQAQLEIDLCEQTIRRYMVRMANEGKLIRLGERRGYKLPGVGQSNHPVPLTVIDVGLSMRVLH